MLRDWLNVIVAVADGEATVAVEDTVVVSVADRRGAVPEGVRELVTVGDTMTVCVAVAERVAVVADRETVGEGPVADAVRLADLDALPSLLTVAVMVAVTLQAAGDAVSTALRDWVRTSVPLAVGEPTVCDIDTVAVGLADLPG
jgi:hypothetical protein